MSISRRQLRVAMVIGVVIGIVAMPVLGSVLSGLVVTSGAIPVSTNTGTTVNVVGASDIAGTEWTSDNTVEIHTDQGNLTATGGGSANVTIAASDITGTWTNTTSVNVSANSVTLDPEDKEKLTLDGAATAADWRDYALDDGVTDLVIVGPDGTQSDVTFYGFSDGITITAVDADTGSALDVGTTTGAGAVTLTIPHSTRSIELQSGDQTQPPTLSNAAPTGELSTAPDNITVNVTDPDFPDDVVDVVIDYEGTEIVNTSITNTTTFDEAIPSTPQTGANSWTVTATDTAGNTVTKTYTFYVPGTVYFYNESINQTSGEYERITSPTDVEITLSGSDGAVDQVTVTDGTLNLSGYDPSQTFILSINAEGYHPRSVYLDSLYQQNAAFLLSENVTSEQNVISIEDATGRYSDNPILKTQRVINTSKINETANESYQWQTVAGDRLGADNQYQVRFESGQRYRFVIENADGDTRVLGEYTAELTGTIELEIGQITYEFSNETSGYSWTSSVENTSSGGAVKFAYNDYDNVTESVTLEIRTRDGTVIATESFTDGTYGEIAYTEPISQAEYENESYVIEWSAERPGGTVGATRPVGGQGPLDLPLDDIWVSIIYALVTLMFVFIAGGGIHPAAGAITASLWAGVAWYFAIVPAGLGAGAIILAIGISAWMLINQGDEVRGGL